MGDQLWEKYSQKSNSNQDFEFRDKLKQLAEAPGVVTDFQLTTLLAQYADHPVATLSTILEYSKCSKLGLQDISQKCVRIWMSENYCALSLIKISTSGGGGGPGGDANAVQEEANLQKMIFLIPDSFRLSNSDFLTFITGQVVTSISALASGVRQSTDLVVNSRPLASFLEKIYLRFHSSSQLDDLLLHPDDPLRRRDCPWSGFVQSLTDLCRNDFIARRIASKMLLNLSSSTALKFSKILFNSGDSEGPTILLQPPQEFLGSHSTWSHTLSYSIPFKTITHSTRFWTIWASYVYSSNEKRSDLWENVVKSWSSLCSSEYFEPEATLSSAFALVSIINQIQGSNSKGIHFESSKEVTRVFEQVSKCLESLSEAKRAIGMALGQIIADLNFKIDPKAEEVQKEPLKFECKHQYFDLLIQFYENPTQIEREFKDSSNSDALEVLSKRSDAQMPPKILDSDDEEVEEDDLLPYDMSNDAPLNEGLLDSTKTRLPALFSEIHELLVEKSKGDDSNSTLIQFTIMKIPVLLAGGVKIDEKMAKSLARILAEFEENTHPETIIITSLLELTRIRPFPVLDTLATLTFDTKSLTLGHRITIMSRLRGISELLSQERCFSCLEINEKELGEVSPQFIQYIETRRRVLRCRRCSKTLGIVQEVTKEHPEDTPKDLSALNWREIVDLRIKSKTRVFGKGRRASPMVVISEYGTKYLPILWGSLANRLLTSKVTETDLNSIFTCHVLQLLGCALLGSSAAACPSFSHISTQVGELTGRFIGNKEVKVRRSVFSLLAVCLTLGEGKSWVIKAISAQGNLLELLQGAREVEVDPEVKKLLDSVIEFMQRAALQGLGLLFDQNKP